MKECLNNSYAQFKHIAILLRAVVKSFYANADEMKRKIKTGHNKTLYAMPFGTQRIAKPFGLTMPGRSSNSANPKDTLAREIRLFLERNGIDPMYAATAFAIVIAVSYWKDIKNWEELAGWRKLLIITTIIAAVIFSIISLLRLTGVIDL